MKRIFALTLALALVISLAACAGTTNSTPTVGNDIETTAATETTAAENEITFDELAIYESDSFSIVVTGIDAESPSGYVLNLTISNNMEAEEIQRIEYVYETNEDGETEIVEENEYIETVTTNLSCVLDAIKINGTDVDITFSSQAESGTRNYDMLIIDPALADTLGDFTKIELTFSVYDVSTPDVTIATATGIVYPYGNNAAETADAA